MRLCITSHRYAPQIGGYENQIKLLAEHLSKQFSVKVVTYNLSGNPANETINNVQVNRVTPQLIFFRVPFSASYLRKIGESNFDLLHAHGFVPVVSDLSLIYAKSEDKKTVYTHHFDGNVQDTNGLNRVAQIYNRTVAQSSLHFADAIVATTKSYADSSPILKPHLNRTKVIPCFVDCNKFKPESPDKVDLLKRQLKLKNNKTVLFVGRIVPYKGLEYLIQAIEYAKKELGEELNLLLVGGQEGKSITNESQYYKQIRHLATKSNASSNIHFVGRVENNLLPAYYSLADVVALPSVMRGEAFGSVLLEALACGTPIVATNIPGVKDVLLGNITVGKYVPPKNIPELSKALVQIASQKNSQTQKCTQFAYENYRLEKIAQDYVDLYASLGLNPHQAS